MKSIQQFLRTAPKKAKVLHAKWRNFIPCSNFQPVSVIEDSTNYISAPKALTGSSPRSWLGFIKGKSLIHKSVQVGQLRRAHTCHHCPLVPINQIWYNPPGLSLNHYRFQSYEYLLGIKQGRGGGVLKDRYQNMRKTNIYEARRRDAHERVSRLLKDQSRQIIKALHKAPPPRPMVELYKSRDWSIVKQLGAVRFPSKVQGIAFRKRVLSRLR